MKSVILIIVGCGALLAGGYVHGIWTDRWNDGSDLDAAAARLDRVPLKLGDWEGKRVERERDPRSGLVGSETFQFTNLKTGKNVTVFLACGRPGPVSVHTPEVCYAGNGYEVERAEKFTSPRPGLSGQSFFTSRLVRKRTTEQNAQRIFWAWNGGENWEVSDNPRFAFAGTSVLFKMYVIRELTGTTDNLENDPCVELLDVLTPALKKEVF